MELPFLFPKSTPREFRIFKHCLQTVDVQNLKFIIWQGFIYVIANVLELSMLGFAPSTISTHHYSISHASRLNCKKNSEEGCHP